MKKNYIDIEGHPNLKKDPYSGAIINVSKSNLRNRKETMRRKSRNMEDRLNKLEKLVAELHSYNNNNNR